MPQPHLQPTLPAIDDNTETYTQQGSGLVRKWTVGMLRAYLTPYFGDSLVSGETNGSDLILHLASGDTVVIPGVVGGGFQYRIGTGLPLSGLGSDGDCYLDKDNGNVYLKVSGTWQLQFDLEGYISTLSLGGGSSLSAYVNGDAIIVATGPGVTFTRDTASIWTINVPSGVELISANIYSEGTENPGANVTVNIRTTSAVYNQGISTLRVPTVNGVNLGSGVGTLPANYNPTTGSTNLLISVQSVGSGDIQIVVNNFNNASGLGAGATILKIHF